MEIQGWKGFHRAQSLLSTVSKHTIGIILLKYYSSVLKLFES